MHVSFIIPTRDRQPRLIKTLGALGRLPDDVEAEVIVIDDASAEPVATPTRLRNGWTVECLRREESIGAAARNDGAAVATGDWLLMLDDDSYPLDDGFRDALAEASDDVVAIGAEILLPDERHEAGGLPEVFVGCGVAIRRQAFLDAGGYDATFHYYVEEYDLCARLIAAGGRITHDRRFRVRHEKVAQGRDMDAILHRLVRNNGWLAQRYAPDDAVKVAISHVINRYGRIAKKEGAERGYAQGVVELMATLDRQPRRPLSAAHYERFTGLAHVRKGLMPRLSERPDASVAIVDEGKGVEQVRHVVEASGAPVRTGPADVLVVGTLSPGPMLDALARRVRSGRPVITPWTFGTGRLGA